jgi:hypothetical protein
MTDVRKAAEERYPMYTWQDDMQIARVNAFIAGAEWMREQAAQVAEAHAQPMVTFHGIAADPQVRDIAAAIRKIGENDD